MVRVGILGATGYTALELIKILLRHPEVEITTLTSRQADRPHVSAVHPQLSERLDLHLENFAPSEVAARCDLVFSCLPHAASAELVMQFAATPCRVIDFSADYRLDDVETYQLWYAAEHPDPSRVGRVPYGLPELFGEQLREASLVANPGCNPTAPILALAPLLQRGWIEPDGILVDAKCGVSGAGRTPKLTTHFPECNESVVPYNVGRHRHTPEFNQILKRFSGAAARVIFTPHLVPMDRGILTTTYARPRGDVGEQQALDALRQFYADKPFVRIVDHLPATKDTQNSNFCDLTVRRVDDWLLLIGSIDNLVKGASGAAVQNMNWMYGFAESTALA